MPSLLIHYHELSLKGKNRSFFENKLKSQIKDFLKPFGQLEVKKLPGRFLVESDQGNAYQWQQALQMVPGIANTSCATKHQADLRQLVCDIPQQISLTSKDSQWSFAIRARRDHKNYPFTSLEVAQQVGEAVQQRTQWQVDLKNPDQEIFIEVAGGWAYVGLEKPQPGRRGLPVGTAGKGVLLLSGGFDSPVAGHLMQCRGLELTALHCHSAPMVSQASIDKVKELCEILGRAQSQLFLNLIPIVSFQKEVVTQCPESYRIILYRRFMMKLAYQLAQKIGASCLITGDSLGQVASQTIENMTVISHGIALPIMRPLVGMNKQWIIDRSREFHLHDISILPHDDCCGFLMPRKPVTKARVSDVEKYETMIDWEKHLSETIDQCVVQRYECGQKK